MLINIFFAYGNRANIFIKNSIHARLRIQFRDVKAEIP